MRVFTVIFLGLGAVLLSACGGGRAGDGGVKGNPKKLPPKDFLEAPLSLGDIADTSSCFRTRQLIVQVTGEKGGWKWTKQDDGTWDYEFPSVSADGTKKGTTTLKLTNSGSMVRVVYFLETQAGQLFMKEKGASYVKSEVVKLRNTNAELIPDCPDPSTMPLKY